MERVLTTRAPMQLAKSVAANHIAVRAAGQGGGRRVARVAMATPTSGGTNVEWWPKVAGACGDSGEARKRVATPWLPSDLAIHHIGHHSGEGRWGEGKRGQGVLEQGVKWGADPLQ